LKPFHVGSPGGGQGFSLRAIVTGGRLPIMQQEWNAESIATGRPPKTPCSAQRQIGDRTGARNRFSANTSRIASSLSISAASSRSYWTSNTPDSGPQNALESSHGLLYTEHMNTYKTTPTQSSCPRPSSLRLRYGGQQPALPSASKSRMVTRSRMLSSPILLYRKRFRKHAPAAVLCVANQDQSQSSLRQACRRIARVL